MNLKDKYIAWRNKPKKGKKSYIVFSTIIFIVAIIFIYINFTSSGWLIQQSFNRAFNEQEDIRIVQVYSGSTLINEYVGYYRIEEYKGYIVIINEETKERIDVYGASVIVNSPERYQKEELNNG